MTDETKPAPADSTTTSTGYSDDILVVGATVADEEGVLAEGAVAIQGDHALVVARFADTTSARAIYENLLMAEIDGTVHIDGVLVVKADDDGRIHVEKMTDHSTRTGLKWGIVGGVVAAVFLPATIVAGAVALGVAGAAAGKARNLSHRLDVEEELKGVITPGHVRGHGPGHRGRRASRHGQDARRPGGQDCARRRGDGRRDQGSGHPSRGNHAKRQLAAHRGLLSGRGHGPGGTSDARRRHGTTPSISMSSEKLRNVRTRTMSPSVAALSRV